MTLKLNSSVLLSQLGNACKICHFWCNLTTMAVFLSRPNVFSSEFLELPHQSPQLGNMGKHTPIRSGQYVFFQYLLSSTGCIFFRIAQLKTVVWQLYKWTRIEAVCYMLPLHTGEVNCNNSRQLLEFLEN